MNTEALKRKMETPSKNNNYSLGKFSALTENLPPSGIEFMVTKKPKYTNQRPIPEL